MLQLDQWVLDLLLVRHVPALSGGALDPTLVVVLTAIAVLLIALGLAGFRRRDVPIG